MKKILPIAFLGLFVSDAFADDWRMRKFDLDQDGFVVPAELEVAGCVVKPGLFKAADKMMMANFLKENLEQHQSTLLEEDVQNNSNIF